METIDTKKVQLECIKPYKETNDLFSLSSVMSQNVVNLNKINLGAKTMYYYYNSYFHSGVGVENELNNMLFPELQFVTKIESASQLADDDLGYFESFEAMKSYIDNRQNSILVQEIVDKFNAIYEADDTRREYIHCVRNVLGINNQTFTKLSPYLCQKLKIKMSNTHLLVKWKEKLKIDSSLEKEKKEEKNM